jgi:transposase InsO family protein
MRYRNHFLAALKNERVHRTQYPTREHARKDLVRYIELRYNTKRLHSATGPHEKFRTST